MKLSPNNACLNDIVKHQSTSIVAGSDGRKLKCPKNIVSPTAMTHQSPLNNSTLSNRNVDTKIIGDQNDECKIGEKLMIKRYSKINIQSKKYQTNHRNGNGSMKTSMATSKNKNGKKVIIMNEKDINFNGDQIAKRRSNVRLNTDHNFIPPSDLNQSNQQP